MDDYPRNRGEFEARFSTETSCREYLVKLRWPDGFRCSRCGGRKSWPVRRILLQCAGCGHQSSVTAGTIFQDTRKPLTLWFRAMWAVTSQKNGASAIGIQRELGLGSYDTAWTWLHKLRRAMVRPGRDRLAGSVEVDESFWGSEEEGMRGRQTESKVLLVIAAQLNRYRPERRKMIAPPEAMGGRHRRQIRNTGGLKSWGVPSASASYGFFTSCCHFSAIVSSSSSSAGF